MTVRSTTMNQTTMTRTRTACAVIAVALALAVQATARADKASSRKTVRVELRLRVGGALSGPIVDYNEDALVILQNQTPYVFAWDELEGGCAYATRKQLLALQRGGEGSLTADDYFRLGRLAHRHGRDDLTASALRRAKRLDASIDQRIKAWRHDLAASADPSETPEPLSTNGDRRTTDQPRSALPKTTRRDELPVSIVPSSVATVPLTNRRDAVRAAYLSFGDQVQKVIGQDVTLIESDHFLVWTDLPRRERDRLVAWCEQMYAALCRRFNLDPSDDIFLAKCPVFCWRSRARFERFARHFDGYDGHSAIGYTRSIAQNGHVHLVLLREGDADVDVNRFACTLVHEGTHAFVHRLFSSTLIPHWVNEGLADLTAQQVLPDRCHNDDTAALLARQIVRYDWSIRAILTATAPIAVHQYPIAHSVVAFLERRDPKRFAGFIRALKQGRSLSSALGEQYDGLTVDALERQWRASVTAADPLARPQEESPPTSTRR